MPNRVTGFCVQRENLASYLILAARQADDHQFVPARFHELRRRIDAHLVMEIGHYPLPHNFACFRVQRHNGIIKAPNEYRAISISNAVVVPAAAQKESRKLRLIVKSVKLP